MDTSHNRIKIIIGHFSQSSSNLNIEFSQSPFNGTDAYTEGLGDIWSFQFVFDSVLKLIFAYSNLGRPTDPLERTIKDTGSQFQIHFQWH